MGPCKVGSAVFSRRVVNNFELICSSSYKEVMGMQCDLLMSNSRDPRTIALVKGNIGHIFDGSLPHCAESLKLELKKAFDLKKKERQPHGVKLGCSNNSCAWYSNPPPYSTVRRRIYCPRAAIITTLCVLGAGARGSSFLCRASAVEGGLYKGMYLVGSYL